MYAGDPQQSLPHSEEAEEAVLGAVLLDQEALGAIGPLVPQDFYFEKHQLIWEAMTHLAKPEYGATVDEHTVRAYLQAEGKLDQVGGFAYLARLGLLMPDPERVGVYAEIVRDRSRRRQAIHLGGELIRGSLDGTGNANGHFPALVARVRASLDELLASRQASTLASVAEVASATADHLLAGDELDGVRTGIPGLDRLIEAMERGKLWLLAARPGVGKTVLLVELAFREAARADHGSLIFSFEQPGRELLMRRAAYELGVQYGRIRGRRCSPGEYSQVFRWLESVGNRRLWIDDVEGLSLSDLLARAESYKKEHPEISFIGIDHYSKIIRKGTDQAGDKSAAMAALESLAKRLETTVVILDHLNKLMPGAKPAEKDIPYYDGKHCEGILFLHRQLAGKDSSLLSPCGEAIVTKNRGGETGEVGLYFEHHTMAWRELDRQQGLPERERYP